MANMKKIFLSLSILASCSLAVAQAAYILPSPTSADSEVTLYIDINQSQDGTNNNALKAMLTDFPDEPVYLWSWQPAAPGIGNGNWDASNPDMQLEKIGPLLYTMTFVPTDFYGVDGATFFSLGISCLAKLSNGNAHADEGYDGEAKTEDLHIDIIPELCNARVCIFPEIRQEDDFLSITYDNTQETNAGLMDMGPADCYIYLSAKTGPFSSYPYVPSSEVTMTNELQMQPVLGEPGKFRLTIIPSEFFVNVPEEEPILDIAYYMFRPGFTYQGAPPTALISMLQCD